MVRNIIQMAIFSEKLPGIRLRTKFVLRHFAQHGFNKSWEPVAVPARTDYGGQN